ncbi:hypothetical protein V6Z12_D13G148000 [Gossypium hirsutum]
MELSSYSFISPTCQKASMPKSHIHIAVRCKNASVGECSTFRGSTHVSKSRQSGSENVGLSNANIGENPMLRKPNGSSARFIHRR